MSTPESAATSTISPTPLVTSASPTPTAAPAPAAAVPAFGGDCSAVLSDNQVTQLLGEVKPEPAIVGEGYAPAELLGALECQWTGSDNSLRVTALPAGVLPEADAARYAGPGTGCILECRVATESNGTWLLSSEKPTSADIDPRERATALPALELVTASALSATTPRMAERGADWWTLPSCELLDQGIDMSALLGVPSTEQVFYSDNIPQGEVWDALRANELDIWCPWTEIIGDDPEDSFSRGDVVHVQLWPGAATTAAMSATMAGDSMTPVTVDGADAAVAGVYYREVMSVYAVDGPNVIWVYGTQGVDTLAAVASAVLDTLA